MIETPTSGGLRLLPLDALHRRLGAKFAGFGGYDMPIQYEGLLAEHAWTRSEAGLFDVSHMGPSFLSIRPGQGLSFDAAHAAAAALIEPLVPSDIRSLKPGQIRYTTLLNAEGGVIDDLMVGRPAAPEAQGTLYVVVNAGGKKEDFALLNAAAGGAGALTRADDRALLALQGPKAEVALSRLAPRAAILDFMHFSEIEVAGAPCVVARSGYTGEDGFEILVPAAAAPAVAETLLAQPEVKPIGLGARDTLRLEAGLCLYGHDLDPHISPVEADLAWIIQKRRRQEGGFPGAARILGELANQPQRLRVGLSLKDRAPAREGVEIAKDGRIVGRVTSGGFSPTLGAPISMGYVERAFATPGECLDLIVRGAPRPAIVTALPFVPHRYKRSMR